MPANPRVNRLGTFVLPLMLLASPAFACSVPVFRYALDHWQADNFQLEVSPGAASDPAVAKFLRNLGANSPLNLDSIRMTSADVQSRLLAPKSTHAGAPPLWSGKLDAAVLGTLTNSPARREIVSRLLDGQSAVWLLIESGNREADNAAAAKLGKRIAFLESAAVLPGIDPNDPTSQLGPGPALKVKFSMLRVKRDDPAEAAFVAMVGGPKQLTASGETLLAPVFGRGRVLGAWPAKDLDSEQIDEACLFLLGACSCQVKQINPGWDILLAVDWDSSLRAIGFPQPAAPAAKAGGATTVETVTIRAGGGGNNMDPGSPASTPTKLAAAAITLFLIAVGGMAWHSGQVKS